MPRLTKRLQRTGISLSPIDNLQRDAVVARPLKRISVGHLLSCFVK
jgi:hypothetical protein